MPVAEEVLALARVQAYAAGRAVVTAGAQRVQVDPDTAIVAPLKMAGEERVWAAAFGRRDGNMQIVVAGDPRNRDDETKSVLAPLAAFLDGYFNECWSEERAPQVWVASGATVGLLDAVGDRRNSRDQWVGLLGRHAWFLSDRVGHAGQQVLLSATDVLSQHFATGQSEFEDQHLGALLAWLEPQPTGSAYEAARAAEELPAGIQTDVIRIDMALEERLQELGRLRREEQAEKRQRQIVAEVQALVAPEAKRVYGLIERSIGVLERQGLPPLPSIDHLRDDDASSFAFYMRRGFIPVNFSDKESAQQLAKREESLDKAKMVLLRGDGRQQRVAKELGEVLDGKIVQLVEGSREGSIHEVVIETSQEVSRLRPGDVMRVGVLENIALQLVDAQAPDAQGTRRMSFLVKTGKTKIAPYAGKVVRLFPGSGGGWAGGILKILSEVHDAHPWVLDRDQPVPEPTGHDAPADPLGALEELR